MELIVQELRNCVGVGGAEELMDHQVTMEQNPLVVELVSVEVAVVVMVATVVWYCNRSL